jgi:hypothetical protein
MRKAFTTSLILFATTLAGAAAAAPVTWTLQKPAVRAQIMGGPWVLAEADAAAPTGGFPTPNPGTNTFQPYYQSFVAGNDQVMQGFFDYRPYKLEEAIVAAASSDFGRTWTFQQKALDFSPSVDDAAAPASDVANGHPFVATVNGKTFLYNLDRSKGFVGKDELIVHEITAPTPGAPLNGVPAKAQLGLAATKTVGLTRPDGIVAVLPSASPVTTFMYLEKQLVADFDGGQDAGVRLCADASAPIDRTQLHLVDTTDGTTFTNDRLVSGILESGNGASVGPRGTIHKYADGKYGFFFSAGTLDECEDSDAFDYIGYAESTDLLNWTVINGLKNPLISTKDADKEAWYAGRTYAPNVLFSADGCKATMVFSGYAAYSPSVAPKNDYRQIGVISLARACETSDAGDSGVVTDAGTKLDAGGTVDAGTTRVDSGINPDTGGGDDGGCSYAPAAATGGAAWIALGGLGLMVAGRRPRAR